VLPIPSNSHPDWQEIVLHALHESGQIQLQDLEAHIKDDIEREGGKIAEMTRKVKQAYKEVVSAHLDLWVR
jgi:transcriptional activator SPT7